MAKGAAVAAALRALVATSIELADRLAGEHDSPLIEVVADRNGEGDAQHRLDALAHQLFTRSLRTAPVRAVLSEEAVDPIENSRDGQVVVAIDPIDGSSNLDVNGAIGTIFSILPAVADDAQPHASFMVTGDHQLAAGLVLYGPATVLALTLGAGTDLFVLDRTRATFVLARSSISVPDQAGAFAVNMSNRRHWPSLVRRYVDDLLAGTAGVRERDFNMRWVGALVADAFRILNDGGRPARLPEWEAPARVRGKSHRPADRTSGRGGIKWVRADPLDPARGVPSTDSVSIRIIGRGEALRRPS
jgi:fructose-1,6-bisphosphatase I